MRYYNFVDANKKVKLTISTKIHHFPFLGQQTHYRVIWDTSCAKVKESPLCSYATTDSATVGQAEHKKNRPSFQMARFFFSDASYTTTSLPHYSTTPLLQNNHLVRLLEIPEPERVEIRSACYRHSPVALPVPHDLTRTGRPLLIIDQSSDFPSINIVHPQ